MNAKPPRLEPVSTVARTLNVDTKTVRRWCVDGRVLARRLPTGAWRVCVDASGFPVEP